MSTIAIIPQFTHETTHLRNDIDGEKVVALRNNMIRNGWQGRPVIVADMGDHTVNFTGSHRLAAVAGLDVEPETLWLPDDLSADDWDLIDGANDDDALLRAFEEIAEARGDIGEIVAVMRAEIEANG